MTINFSFFPIFLYCGKEFPFSPDYFHLGWRVCKTRLWPNGLRLPGYGHRRMSYTPNEGTILFWLNDGRPEGMWENEGRKRPSCAKREGTRTIIIRQKVRRKFPLGSYKKCRAWPSIWLISDLRSNHTFFSRAFHAIRIGAASKSIEKC